jgi:hypothetical protein
MKIPVIVLTLFVTLSIACKDKPAPNTTEDQQINTLNLKLKNAQKEKETNTISYEWHNVKDWLLNHQTDTKKLAIACAINRTDSSNFARMDSVIVPTNLGYDLAIYMPFPLYVEKLSSINKVLFFSYTYQTFAAYENGVLVFTGPTNMGNKRNLTPTGLFFSNWKAEETTSTFNDEWILKWNFNIVNNEGIGWHEYSMPGYPASHSCLRLQKKDAQNLYNWADQWILEDAYTLLAKGTPVIIFGHYDFQSPKPWLQLLSNSHALDFEAKEIEAIVQPNMITILNAQKHRDSVQIQMQKGLE